VRIACDRPCVRGRALLIVSIKGANALLTSVPLERWAVVTSGLGELAPARLRAAGLPTPRVLVSADDVTMGKPTPRATAPRRSALDYRQLRLWSWKTPRQGSRRDAPPGSRQCWVSESGPLKAAPTCSWPTCPACAGWAAGLKSAS
jgi:hypothetical protein